MKRFSILFLFILTACASLPVLEIAEGTDLTDKRFYYDKDSEVAYSANYDENNIYITLKTDNENTIKRIFRNGLYVYLDPNGRKSKNIYFEYPLAKKMRAGKPNMEHTPMSGNMKREFNINELIDNSDMEAIFSTKEFAEKLPVYSQKTDIKVELSASDKNEFLYMLRIPFDRIEKVRSSEYAIGIVTGEMEMPQMGGGSHQGGGMPGNDMQGAGMSNGGMSGGQRPEGAYDRNSNMQNIDIWFKILMNRGE